MTDELRQNPTTEGVRLGADWVSPWRGCTILVRSDASCCQRNRSTIMPLLGGLVGRLTGRLTGGLVSGLVLMSTTFVVVPAVAGGADDDTPVLSANQERRDARGWLELEQEQRAYRDRVAPLDLKQQRQLEIIERSQRLDLRRMQQRDAREIERLERQQRLRSSTSRDAYSLSRRGAAADIQRRVEQRRARIRNQQEGNTWSPVRP